MLENKKTWLEKLSQGEKSLSETKTALSNHNNNSSESKDDPKFIKVLIKSSDGDKVNIKIPLAFAKLLLNIHPKVLDKTSFKSSDIDFCEILDMLEEGAFGELVDIESNDGDIVKVIVE